MKPEKALNREGVGVASGSRFVGLRDLDSAAAEVLEFLAERVGFKHWLLVRNQGSKRTVLSVSANCLIFRTGEEFLLPPGLEPPRGEPAFLHDLKGSRVPRGFGAYLEVPFLSEDGSALGALCAFDPEPQPKAVEREMHLVGVMANMLGWLIETSQSVQRLEREAERASVLAMTDDLTQLPNRRAWNQIVEQEDRRCRKQGTCPQVILADLDGLKATNDAFGHAAGDRLLKDTARILGSQCRKTDFVARLGGDEFGVLLLEGSDTAVKRILAALDAEGIKCTLGQAPRRPPFGLLEAIRAADTDLCEQKALRRSQTTPTTAAKLRFR